MEQIENRLRAARVRAGLSREEVAKAAGLHPRTIAAVELEEGRGWVRAQARVAVVLGVDLTAADLSNYREPTS